MKAIRVHEFGGAEVLRLEEIPDPTPAPGEALVRMEAVGINFIEVYRRTGAYPMKLPYTPGEEGAGVVVAVGEGVTTVRVGDRVASETFKGSYAELAVASVERLVVIPDGVETRVAAAAMLQGMTAHYVGTTIWPLAPGDWCLLHAAAGGVGLLLTQIATRRGATVIGTTSTPEKATLAREAGAAHVVLYENEDFVAEVRRLTNGRGVDVVFDSVGKSTFDGSLDCLRRRGMMVLFGQSSGAVPPFDPQILNRKGSLFLTRPTLAHYTATRAELETRAGDIFGWIADKSLHVRISSSFSLGDAAEAHRALEARRTTGKVILVP
jgi:NADPH2:quinone reductase